jgi:KAP family P-loop domain
MADRLVRVRDDRPIRRSINDGLGRKGFAYSIAERILHATVTNGLVVGIIGKWGDGKTSIINMIVERLSLLPTDLGGPMIVRFNPWRYGTDADLATSLLLVLADALGGRQNLAKLDVAAKRLHRLSQAMQFASHVPVIGKAFEAVGKGTKAAAMAAEKGEDLLGRVDAIYEEVSDALRDQEQLIVVTIDDIDRLQTEQIRQVFRLVKSVADFPNIVYLLAYDRRIVESSIYDNLEMSRAYLEKIVTIPIVIPSAQQEMIDTYILNELKQLYEMHQPRFLEEHRLSQIYIAVIRSFVRSLRDASRLLNAYDFGYAELRDEVDVVDLLGLTVIEVFAPDAYDAIRDHYQDFIGVDGGSLGDSNSARARIERHLITLPERQQGDVRELVRWLFPKVRPLYPGLLPFASSGSSGRVGSLENFRRFFLRRVVEDELDAATVSDLTDILQNNGEEFRCRISKHSQKQIGYFLAILAQGRNTFRRNEADVLVHLAWLIDGRTQRPRSAGEIDSLLDPEQFYQAIAGRVIGYAGEPARLVRIVLERLVHAERGLGCFLRYCSGYVVVDDDDIPYAKGLIAACREVMAARLPLYLEKTTPCDPRLLGTLRACKDMGVSGLDSVAEKLLAEPEWAVAFALSSEEEPGFAGSTQTRDAKYDIDAVGRFVDLYAFHRIVKRALRNVAFVVHRDALRAFFRQLGRRLPRAEQTKESPSPHAPDSSRAR